MTIERFGIAIWLVACGVCFGVSQNAQAVALAESSISFANLQITPRDPTGAVAFSNGYMEAYAEASNSLGEFDQQFSFSVPPEVVAADAAVTWAESHGDAAALEDPPDFDVVVNADTLQVLIPDHIKDAWAASLGRGMLSNLLVIDGGTPGDLVEVDFAGMVDYFLHVLTTNNGVYAETETIFALEVFGLPLVNDLPQNSLVLFFQDRLTIGPDSEDGRQGLAALSGARFLEFGQPYVFMLESDSESFAVVPEPPTVVLMLLSLGILAGFTSKRYSTTSVF